MMPLPWCVNNNPVVVKVGGNSDYLRELFNQRYKSSVDMLSYNMTTVSGCGCQTEYSKQPFKVKIKNPIAPASNC